jgi:hypothetical protein
LSTIQLSHEGHGASGGAKKAPKDESGDRQEEQEQRGGERHESSLEV